MYELEGAAEGVGPGPGQGSPQPGFSHFPDSSLTSDPPLALAPLLSIPVGLSALSSASKFTSLFLPQGRERPATGEPQCEPVPRREGWERSLEEERGRERQHCLKQWPSWGRSLRSPTPTASVSLSQGQACSLASPVPFPTPSSPGCGHSAVLSSLGFGGLPPLTSSFSFSLEPQSYPPLPQVSCPTFSPGSCKGCHPGDPSHQSQDCWPVSQQMGWVGSQTQRKKGKKWGALESEGAVSEPWGHTLPCPSDSMAVGRPSRLGHGLGAARRKGCLRRIRSRALREKGGVQSPEGMRVGCSLPVCGAFQGTP